MPGIFVTGVRHGSVKRIATAVGEGAMVVQFVHQYLEPVMREDDLRRAPAFADLTDEQFRMIMSQGREVTFPKETTVIEEGAEAKGLYILLEGEMTVTKQIRGRTVTLSRMEPVNFVGEISVMTGFPPMATVRTVTDARLLFFDIDLFRQIFDDAPLIRILLSTMAERLRRMEAAVRQEEKLTALGRLSAGLAHELNNPAAASVRAARQLPEVLIRLQKLVFHMNEMGFSPEQHRYLNERQNELMRRLSEPDRSIRWNERTAKTPWPRGSRRMASRGVAACADGRAQITVDELNDLKATMGTPRSPRR